MADNFFPKRPESRPTIYAYEDTTYPGLLKVGYTTRDVNERVAQQYPTKRPEPLPYNIVLQKPAVRGDGSCFTDHDVHRVLRRMGIENPGGEWFCCSLKDVEAAILEVETGRENSERRHLSFKMRPEQEDAVCKTEQYFRNIIKSEPGSSPKFLWNAKMRFGKTFAAYQLAKRMGYKKVLILTFKPAVEASWEEDLMSHIDFEGWQFYSRHSDKSPLKLDQKRPIVCFGSFQDYLGIDKKTGGIKPKNEWVHKIKWDIVIFDEYHFGAWRDNAKNLFKKEDEDSYDTLDMEEYQEKEAGDVYNETFLPITSSSYLFLSGTPFRALNSGEFIEEQIFNWTYSDEQRAKAEWSGEGDNPYEALPRMVLLTYKMPDHIVDIAKQGEFNEFDLSTFFSAEGHGTSAQFVFKDHVQKWLDLIRGGCLETTSDELRLGGQRPPMPFSDVRLLSVLTHTMWFMPNVASCYAMANLLRERQNSFYHDYALNICAGPAAGIGISALVPVRESMKDPLHSKSITLSCGKLTAGVTIRPWTGIFMLRNLSSPETYFQAAFRIQSPWTIKKDDGKEEIIKQECYIFDFALDRSLRQISDYSCRLNVTEKSVENKVGEFINFLPVLAYDGSSMHQVSAIEILDITTAGTSAVLLAKRWQSALLVNVDNDTLKRIIGNKEAMDAIMKIEGFRALGSNVIETVINRSEAVKKARKENKNMTAKQKEKLSKDEKEYKKKRKEIQEKLIKFATRVPIFMYLTDYRERSLKDVITQLEPGLFKRVTGLETTDFETLVSLGVFNSSVMNEAIFKFKRYEDASLSYSGIDRHSRDDSVGLFDTTISREDYNRISESSRSEQFIEIRASQ